MRRIDKEETERHRQRVILPARRLRPWRLMATFSGILACVLATSVASAAGLEPAPAYSAIRSLRQDAALHAVGFRDGQTGVAVGERGMILRTDDGGERWRPVPSGVQCRLDAVCWIGRRRVVAVGGSYDRITGISRGVVLYSDDAGRQWRRGDDAELPRLRRLAQRSDGTLVAEGDWSPVALADQFESRDGGKSWHGRGERPEPRRPVTSEEFREWTESTGAEAIVRAACRGEQSRLWAVGDHGVIMHSADGGQSWQVQRGRNRQSAVLVVADRPDSVAWPLIGQEALEMRHRVSLLLRESGRERSGAKAALDRASQAVVQLGGCGADRLRVSEDDSAETLRRESLNWIAAHRPAVVVLDESLPEAIRSALAQAAIDTGAERVVTYAVGGRGQTRLHRNALMTSSGVFTSDFWADALQLVAPSVRPGKSITARRIYDAVGAPVGGESVASGLSLSTGQMLAADPPETSRRRLQVAEARLNMRQRLEPMLAPRSSPESLSKTLQRWLEQTPPEDRLRLIWSVWQACEQTGGPRKQSAVLDVLQQQFPDRSAGRWAAMRREAIAHSREWSRLPSPLARRETAGDRVAAEPVPVSPFQIPAGNSGGTPAGSSGDTPGGVVPASATSPLLVPERRPIELAVPEQESAEAGGAVDLAWEFHPLVLVAREAARRRGDDQSLQATDKVSADLRRLVQASSAGPWQRLLSGPAQLTAPRAEQPPQLDGVADEPCWSQPPVPLGASMQLRLAYDEEYVYVAIRCPSDALTPQPSGESNRSSDSERPARRRDHDLSGVDRLELSFDTDRDLLTAMRLAFSAAGHTHDSVDGDPAWQPTWYVAPRRGDEHVDWELAILRRDLVDLPLHSGQSWFVSLRRLAAGESRRSPPMPSASRWLRVEFQ